MKHWQKKIMVAAFAICTTTVNAAQGAQTQTWWQQMQQLSKIMSELLVDIASDQRFNDPRNAARIQKDADQLAKLVHNIQPTSNMVLPPDADPSIPIMAKLFQEQTSKASKELAAGHRSYARSLLRSSAGYCIACHTRTAAPTIPALSLKPDVKDLNKYEKAEIYVAMRDFDRAFHEYDSIAGDIPLAKANPLIWEKSIRTGLAVAVRVEQNPQRAAALVKRVLDMPVAPEVTKADAKVWMKSIQDWEKEPMEKMTAEGGRDAKYIKAKHLIQEAQATQKYPTDHSADVLYLRATATIHQLLRMQPTPDQLRDALYWAGLSYDALHDLNLWSLHDMFYQACIQTAPHTLTAKKCYKEYEESMRENYSGSMGTEIPSDVQSHLNQLKKLAY